MTTYLSLMRVRFRFYVTESGNVFLRRWQWFLLAGLLIPGLPIVPIFKTPGHLFKAVASSSLDFKSRGGLFLLIQLIQVIWILPQMTLLRGGRFRGYVRTLPISRLIQNSVTISLIAIADILLLIPATYGFSLNIPSSGTLALFRLIAWATVISNLLLLQLGLAERYDVVVLTTVMADWPLSAALTGPPRPESWLLLLLAMGCPIAAINAPSWVHARFQARGRVIPYIRQGSGRLFLDPLSPSLRIRLKALTERPVASCVIIFGAIGVAGGLEALLSTFSYDERSLPVVIIGLAVTALIISGLYRSLRQAHTLAEELLSTLPIRRNSWIVKDVLFLGALGCIPMVMLLFPLMKHNLTSLPVMISLGLGYLALLSGLRVIVAKGGKFSVMLSTAFAAVWATSAIAAAIP